jgi:hypothetical protein
VELALNNDYVLLQVIRAHVVSNYYERTSDFNIKVSYSYWYFRLHYECTIFFLELPAIHKYYLAEFKIMRFDCIEVMENNFFFKWRMLLRVSVSVCYWCTNYLISTTVHLRIENICYWSALWIKRNVIRIVLLYVNLFLETDHLTLLGGGWGRGIFFSGMIWLEKITVNQWK